MSDYDAPADVLAEMTLLGTVMSAPELGADLGLTASDFYDARNGLVYAAVARLREAGDPADPAAVAAALTTTGELERVGGPGYLATLYTAPGAGTATEWHVRRVMDLANVRRVIEGAARLGQMARKPDADPKDLAANISDLATQIGDRLIVGGPTRWATILEDAIDRLEAESDRPNEGRGIASGLVDLDRMTNGFKPGQLIIVAARPGVGKTVCATDFARSAAFKQAVPTLLISLEMSNVEMAKRIIAAQYQMNLHTLSSASLSEAEWVHLATRSSKNADAPLWIDDTPNQSLATIRAVAKRLHRSDKLGLLVVDYLQLIETAAKGRQENRQQEVSVLSRGLKLLARELEIPVVFLAQLNRGPEHRADKTPMLSDLRESGSLEQDADIVILLHREDYYEKDSPRAGELDLIVAKHRGGPTDTITVAAQLHYSRFVNMSTGEVPTGLRGVA